MRTSTRRWLTWGGAGLVLGVALGLFVGWWLWPLSYADASPLHLRSDYRDEYALMIAQAYHVDRDLAAAHARLSALDPDDPAAPVRELAERLLASDGAGQSAALLSELAESLRVDGSLATNEAGR